MTRRQSPMRSDLSSCAPSFGACNTGAPQMATQTSAPAWAPTCGVNDGRCAAAGVPRAMAACMRAVTDACMSAAAEEAAAVDAGAAMDPTASAVIGGCNCVAAAAWENAATVGPTCAAGEAVAMQGADEFDDAEAAKRAAKGATWSQADGVWSTCMQAEDDGGWPTGVQCTDPRAFFSATHACPQAANASARALSAAGRPKAAPPLGVLGSMIPGLLGLLDLPRFPPPPATPLSAAATARPWPCRD
mmetsp:Transcript_5814/g.16072  ORF Transcript_5814/g.16072 Transcript_5814/m.16072 type:complete len:246 (-) Transcript_5814:188-925(-)